MLGPGIKNAAFTTSLIIAGDFAGSADSVHGSLHWDCEEISTRFVVTLAFADTSGETLLLVPECTDGPSDWVIDDKKADDADVCSALDLCTLVAIGNSRSYDVNTIGFLPVSIPLVSNDAFV